MKILIVSWYFPPCSTMGALRVGKFAKYLVAQGHDVKIVCANDQPYAKDHPVEVPADIVHHARTRNVNWLPVKVQYLRVWLGKRRSGRDTGGNGEKEAAAPATTAASAGSPGLLRRVLTFYQHLTNIPDGVIGWLLPALAAGRRATRDWTPDIVFASAPPFTTLIAGRMIARRAGAALVVEYRDRWIEDPYGEQDPAWRQRLDRRIEEWCARPARAVVTVSEPWAEDYRARWGKPVTVCYNGYDPEDMTEVVETSLFSPNRLNILYTGILYPQRRDPTPLFDALELLGENKNKVAAHFFGSNVEILREDVIARGLEDSVNLWPSVPLREALSLQAQADILLLLQWNDPQESGNVPGKLFEYLAARRPILGIGYVNGVPANMISNRSAWEGDKLS